MYDRRENTSGTWSDTVGTEFNQVRLLKPLAVRDLVIRPLSPMKALGTGPADGR